MFDALLFTVDAPNTNLLVEKTHFSDTTNCLKATKL